MPLQAQPATEADAARAIAIEMVAYGKHPLSSILFPGPPPPPDHPSSRVNFLISQLRESPDNCKWYKVVDTDLEGEDSMIAFSMWYTYATPKTKQTTPREWGPGTNPEVCEAYFGGMTSNYEQKWANKAHMYFKLLHTDPKHQRRGAGGLLLKTMTEEADKLGVPVHLEATPEGEPLYVKWGFERTQLVVTDFSKWGGPAHHEYSVMVRQPKGQ